MRVLWRSEGDGRRVAAAEPGQRGAPGRQREDQPEPRDGLLLHHGVGTGFHPDCRVVIDIKSFLFVKKKMKKM